uniref:Uncharacterized protein n=1 Tax=Anguilla anguilla TaxID=7936 RepID=A0A0E9QZ29_ANGAN
MILFILFLAPHISSCGLLS